MLPTLNDLPVCILSTVASFVDCKTFSEFIRLSRANHDAHLLPPHIKFFTKNISEKILLFRKWFNLHRNLAIVIPQINLEWTDLSEFPDEDLSSCSGMNIEKLLVTFHICNYTGQFLRHFVSMPLTELSICGAEGLIDSSLIYISQLPLTSLQFINGSQITNAGLKHLASLRLTSLKLWRSLLITDDGLANMANMPLTELVLNRSENLTDATLLHLTHCPLTYLNLEHCGRFSDDGVAHLAHMPLTELNVDSCYQLTNTSLSHLTQCPLRKLDVSYCSSISTGAVVRTLHLYSNIDSI